MGMVSRFRLGHTDPLSGIIIGKQLVVYRVAITTQLELTYLRHPVTRDDSKEMAMTLRFRPGCTETFNGIQREKNVSGEDRVVQLCVSLMSRGV